MGFYVSKITFTWNTMQEKWKLHVKISKQNNQLDKKSPRQLNSNPKDLAHCNKRSLVKTKPNNND